MNTQDKLAGLFLGLAVGDSLGLPFEGLTSEQIQRRLKGKRMRHSFIAGRGMISDDTEHACLVGQALLSSQGAMRSFLSAFAWQLRRWFLALPAGIGLATGRALIKLCLGYSAELSGVRSAGNGPAIRGAVIGAVYARELTKARALCERATLITHTDPRAVEGTWLVAKAVASAMASGPEGPPADLILEELRVQACGEEMRRRLDDLAAHLARRACPKELAASMGLSRGVTGYINHTVPIALYCWLLHPTDYAEAVTSVIELGGDTDSTAAIVGALVGATAGAASIPSDWLCGLRDAPRSIEWMKRLAARLALLSSGELSDVGAHSLPLIWPLIPLRNTLFLITVLCHGIIRLARGDW